MDVNVSIELGVVSRLASLRARCAFSRHDHSMSCRSSTVKWHGTSLGFADEVGICPVCQILADPTLALKRKGRWDAFYYPSSDDLFIVLPDHAGWPKPGDHLLSRAEFHRLGRPSFWNPDRAEIRTSLSGADGHAGIEAWPFLGSNDCGCTERRDNDQQSD